MIWRRRARRGLSKPRRTKLGIFAAAPGPLDTSIEPIHPSILREALDSAAARRADQVVQLRGDDAPEQAPASMFELASHWSESGRADAVRLSGEANARRAERDALAAIRRLVASTASTHPAVAADAEARLCRVFTDLFGSIPGRVGEAASAVDDDEHHRSQGTIPRLVGRIDRLVDRFDDPLSALRARLIICPRSLWPARGWWTAASSIVTAVVCWTVIGGAWAWAAALLTARIGISATLPPPYDIGRAHVSRIALSWKAAATGHIVDAASIFAVAVALTLDQKRTAYAAAVGLAALVMLSGSLYRMAALEGAVFVRRLSLERVLRNGPLVLGLLAAARWQPAIPQDGLPLIALTPVGALLSTGIECLRVFRHDADSTRRRARLSPPRATADRHREIGVAVEEYALAAVGSFHSLTTGQRRRSHRRRGA